MMLPTSAVVAAIVVATGLLVSCSTAPTTTTERDELSQKATAERQEWYKLDPGIEALAKKSHGFAFFPEIGKGGLVVGGAYGRGVIYERSAHRLCGYDPGVVRAAGGRPNLQRAYRVRNKATLERFKANQLDFGANASAIIAKTGAAMNARFVDGVAVFVRPTGSAMAEASLGGQRITYVAK